MDGAHSTNSRALAFAVEHGFKPQLAYKVSETAAYLGVDEKTLRAEHAAGRLKFVMPNGCTKGARITCDEVDRWIRETES